MNTTPPPAPPADAVEVPPPAPPLPNVIGLREEP